jgi:hypothetical protein
MRRTNMQEQTIRIGRRGVLLGTREVIHARSYGRTLGIGNTATLAACRICSVVT